MGVDYLETGPVAYRIEWCCSTKLTGLISVVGTELDFECSWSFLLLLTVLKDYIELIY